MSTQTTTCPKCSAENFGFDSNCRVCGTMLPVSYQNQQMQPPPPNYAMQGQQIPGADKKMLSGILGIFLGGLGIHKFVLGYTNEGIIMIAIQVVGWFLCGIPSLVISIIGLIEGIIYLTKSDEDFVRTYIQNKKGWF